VENPEFEGVPQQSGFDFPYLDRDEAMFLLGRIRDGLECSLCPRWSRGCTANHTRAEMMGIPLKQFVEKQIPGTEGHMCAKLRNIVNMSDAELEQLHKSYDLQMKSKIGFLDKIEGKVTYKNASLEHQVQDVERRLTEKMNATRDYYEKQMAVLRLEANRKIEEAMRIKETQQYLFDQATALEEANHELSRLKAEAEALRQENAQLKQNQPPNP
jgi:hypothetical protein